jgi:hypothetical protein
MSKMTSPTREERLQAALSATEPARALPAVTMPKAPSGRKRPADRIGKQTEDVRELAHPAAERRVADGRARARS